MWTRAELKEHARKAFNEQYWLCVGVVVVVNAIVSAVGLIFTKTPYGSITYTYGSYSYFFFSYGSFISILVSGPLTIGMNYFFLKRFYGGNSKFEVIFTKGFVPYGRKLGGMLWMQLFTFLWTLLFIIPGIIKSLSYAMTPYILGDCPDVKAKDALKLSMRMMEGHKAELFVLYLSFIGWAILCALTFGILYIFYVGPYVNATIAGYYGKIKTLALDSGVVAPEELNPLRNQE